MTIYEHLLEELAGGELPRLQRQVYELLKEHPHGLERQELILRIYGYFPAGDLSRNTDDRKIRKAIERLRQRLFPVISTSAKAGYRLDVSREAVQKMITELQRRKMRIQEQIDAASKFYEIPEYREPVPAAQAEMNL